MNIEASGQNLEQTRKLIGISQKDLYQAVNVSRATYHNWVVGKSEPSASQFFTMLQVCWRKRNPDVSPALFDQQVNKLISLEAE
ncbi:helix-turn-helix domain-containing protein [Catenovulum sp. 2E275]|uniref:helix-turn-helix domain-containing protein n=1 Tax=Catenovulum sp. 2E275 TaxID=2980497 RepID=UPI0021D3D4B8|nr:helix-turn-helix transcriptional regulator [Catenovulum sp. 2E275]MCU4676883.1 helix-turn-helix domain-containing protein [Catenovulum sp. 2E275]